MDRDRFIWIDVVRALAILFMIQGHFVYYWSDWYALRELGTVTDGLLFYWIDMESYSAPAFAFLVGVSVWLWRLGNQSQYSSAHMTGQLMVRGIGLFVIGLVMSMLSNGGLMVGSILNLLGLGVIVVAAFRATMLFVPLVFLALLLLSAPYLQAWSGYQVLSYDQIFWPSQYQTFEGVALFTEVLKNYFLRGYQPFIPWLVFPVAGYMFARWVFAGGTLQSGRIAATVLLGSLLLLGSAAIVQLEWGSVYVFSYNYFPATTAFMIGALGVVIFSLAISYTLVGGNGLSNHPRLRSFLQVYSKFSLSAYIIHNIFALFILRLYGYLCLDNAGRLVGDGVVSYTVALLMAWGFIAVFYVVLCQWDRLNGGKYSFEWCVRRVSRWVMWSR